MTAILWLALFIIATSVAVLLITWPPITPPEPHDDIYDVNRPGAL